MKRLAVCLLLAGASVRGNAALLSLYSLYPPVQAPAAAGFGSFWPTVKSYFPASGGSMGFYGMTGHEESPISGLFNAGESSDETGNLSALFSSISCEELAASAAWTCDELNRLNRWIYDLSAARASATGQQFRGIPLSPQESGVMNELRGLQLKLAGEAQDLVQELVLLENVLEFHGCLFISCHQRRLGPLVESEAHYISRENADAVYRIQVAPHRPSGGKK